jgi:predicted secreted Zn-dependent protease
MTDDGVCEGRMTTVPGHKGREGWRRATTGCHVLLLLWPALALAQNKVHWTTNYYAVTGATLGEIQQSLSRNRPWKEKSALDGLTDWRIQWHYQLMSSPGLCRLTSFTTTTTIAITLPRWMRPTNAAMEAVTNWNRYITALGHHEAGHAQIGLAAAAEQQRRIPLLGSDVNCEALKKRINELAQQIVDDHGRRDREYDTQTEHGARQGATLRGGFRRRDRQVPR